MKIEISNRQAIIVYSILKQHLEEFSSSRYYDEIKDAKEVFKDSVFGDAIIEDVERRKKGGEQFGAIDIGESKNTEC